MCDSRDKDIKLVQYLVYGDKEIENKMTQSQRDLSREIKHVKDGIDTLSKVIRSGPCVCEECKDEVENFEKDVDSCYIDIDTNIDDIIDEIDQLRSVIDQYENIITDLVSFAADHVTDEDKKTYEEYVIMEKLNGNSV